MMLLYFTIYFKKTRKLGMEPAGIRSRRSIAATGSANETTGIELLTPHPSLWYSPELINN